MKNKINKLRALTLTRRKGLALGTRKGFTLIEVLVASSVLFIVSAAVVGLSNSIIQGTSVTADSTTASRLATEGLELITKIRDDKLKNADFSTGQFVWFDPVEFSDNYGWYALEEDPVIDNLWELNKSSTYSNFVDTTSLNTSALETINSGLVDYHRFICVEAIGAENDQKDEQLNCNTVADGAKTITDGTRINISTCYSEADSATVRKEDVFCEFTEASLNKNNLSRNKIIPDGNAVKVRSVVLWNDKDTYRSTEVATILTNWQSFTQ